MKIQIKKRTFGSKINAALRYFLRLVIYMIVGAAFLSIPIFFYCIIKTNEELGTKFEDRSWAIPARVYARPLELFVGANLKKEDLLMELELINYKKVDQLNQPGTYRENGDTIDIYAREFSYGDSTDPSQKIQITLEKGKIKSLKSAQNNDNLSLARIEPLHIASIYPAHNEDRILLKREEMPQMLVDALLAMEDRQFYQHFGVNPKGIIRALIANLKSGKRSQGGSTLTQQLVKNYFLTPDQSYERKIREMFYALIIDWKYPKDDVLEAYMNEIYLGQDGSRAIHGFGLASQFFFGKPVSELSLNNIATLIGIIPSPSGYNPRSHPKRALERRNIVLNVLVAQNLISQAEADEVKKMPLDVLTTPPTGITKYPSFVDLVTKELRTRYTKEDLTREGLKIFTTLDPVTQSYAEKAVVETLPKLEKQKRVSNLQAALIISKNNTGEIEAMVGDRQVRQAGFNRALSAKRQIGSLMKPFIYLRALEEPQRFSLATLLDDNTPFELQVGNKVWRPQNYDKQTHGWIPLMTALAKSFNVPTVRLGMDVGVQNVIDTLYRLGLSREEQYTFPIVPSTLLGAIDITLFDVTQMYSSIANGGYKVPLHAIREVTRPDGTPLSQNLVSAQQVIFPGPNFLITRAMQEVVNAGTAGRIRREGIKTIVAGKTGTTNKARDSWFAGFSGDRTGVVWIGKDEYKGANDTTNLGGSTGALPIWINVMKNLTLEDINQTPPNDVVMKSINLSTGLPPPSYGCPGSRIVSLPFIKGYQPTFPGECEFYPPEPEWPIDDGFNTNAIDFY